MSLEKVEDFKNKTVYWLFAEYYNLGHYENKAKLVLYFNGLAIFWRTLCAKALL